MQQDKAASLIGLAMKAGKAAGGEFAAEKAIRQGLAQLVILSEDASVNTSKKFSNMAVWNQVPICRYLSKTDLGWCMGKGERSCVVITDRGLADKIVSEIEKKKNKEETGKVVENIGKHQNS